MIELTFDATTWRLCENCPLNMRKDVKRNMGFHSCNSVKSVSGLARLFHTLERRVRARGLQHHTLERRVPWRGALLVFPSECEISGLASFRVFSGEKAMPT